MLDNFVCQLTATNQNLQADLQLNKPMLKKNSSQIYTGNNPISIHSTLEFGQALSQQLNHQQQRAKILCRFYFQKSVGQHDIKPTIWRRPLNKTYKGLWEAN